MTIPALIAELEEALKVFDGRSIEPKPYASDDGYGPDDCWLMAFHPHKGAYNMADGVSKADASIIVTVLSRLPTLIEALKRQEEALEAAEKTLSTASRMLSEEHKMVLRGKQWGESTLVLIRAALTAHKEKSDV